MRRLLACLLVIGFAVAGCGGGRASPQPRQPIAKLKEALEAMRGRPVVVNYWGTWCDPCRLEMPRLVDAYKKYSDRVGFLGVNVEDDAQAAADFASEYEIPFRSISDPLGEIRRAQKAWGLPVTEFYSADGERAYVHQGEIQRAELEEKIENVLRLD